MTPNNARGLWSWKAAFGLDNLQLAWKKSRRWKHALIASSPSASAGAGAGPSAPTVARWGGTARQQAGERLGPRRHAGHGTAISVFQTSVAAGRPISALELEGEQPQQQQMPGKAGGVGEMQRQVLNPLTVNQVHHGVKGEVADMENCSVHTVAKGGPTNLLIRRDTGSCVTANKYLCLKKSKSSLIWELWKNHLFLMGRGRVKTSTQIAKSFLA